MEALGLKKEEMRSYGEFVRDTLKERVGKGARSCEERFEEQSNRSLLEMTNENTMKSERGGQGLQEWKDEMGEEGNQQSDDSILRERATDEQIPEIEEHLSIDIPQEWKELYKLSNGTSPMLLGNEEGRLVQFLGPLEDWAVQDPVEDSENVNPVLEIDEVDGGLPVHFLPRRNI